MIKLSNEGVWTIGLSVAQMLVVFVLSAIALCLAYSWLPGKVKDWLWRVVDKSLKYAFIIVWVLGFLVYGIGAYVYSPDASFLWHSFSVIPMAVIHSTEMFLGQSDISSIHSDCHENALFMLLFSLVHFLAILCSMVFVLHQFGYYLAEEAKIGFNSLLAKCGIRRPKNLYIFWGINEQSLILAEGIKDNIIFVRTFDDEEAYNSNVGFKRVFGMVKLKNKEIDMLRHLRCRVTTAFHRLSKLEHAEDGREIIGNDLNLKALNRLMKHATGDVHLLMLNDDEETNIRCTTNLQKDATIQKMLAQHRNVHLYCHAAHSAKTRGLEISDICNYDTPLHIHIIDSSRLSVFWLKDNLEYHPVNFVSIDKKTASVTSPFRAAIIGFGETGQEAFNFLYEFGAFVDSDGNKSPFHCSIIDESAKTKAGLFLAKAPSLPEAERDFYDCPIDSSDYWQLLRQEVEAGLSNLFITLSDEELAIDVAINFCTLAVRWITDNERRINVYIRSYKQENIERLKTVRDELNGKYAAINIVIFGNVHDIFTYDIIINDRYLRDAKRYNFAYDTGHVPAADTAESLLDDCWYRVLKCARTKDNPVVWNVEDTERRRDQCLSNALHAQTKMYLLAQTGRPADYWRDKNLQRMACTPDYPDLTQEDSAVLINIAKVEHERWIAASRLQGQTLADGQNKDDQHKRHTDLVPWDDIRKWDEKEKQETQGYDCLVVDTTIELALYNNK